jgi:O-antigen ligase
LVAIYVLIINYCRSQRHWNIITLSFAAGAVISATATILLGSTYKGLDTDSARTTLSEEFNPNYLSSMLGTGIILIFYHLYKTRYNWLKVLFLLATIPLIYAIIRAQSRGVWIGLPAALLVSLLLTTRNLQLIRKIVVVITVLIGIIASAYYAGIIDEAVTKRYKTISSRGTSITTEGRADIWKVGLEMIKDTFPLGVGFKNYKAVFHKYAPNTNVYMEAYKVQKGRDPHNTFLGVLVETGLVGFILFMGIFVHLFKRIWRIEDLFIRLVQMWLFTFLILISLKGTINFTPWFWIILAYISLVTSVDRQKNHEVLSR